MSQRHTLQMKIVDETFSHSVHLSVYREGASMMERSYRVGLFME